MTIAKNVLINTLDHLPERKKQELAIIKELILKHVKAEMIILFGSYATGKWVEDKYIEDGITYEYISDFDILVVTKNKIEDGSRRWQEIEAAIKKNPFLTKTVIISHTISFFNEKIRGQYYFFTDIYKEGIMLYDSQRYTLDAPQKLSPTKRKQKAEKYFEHWTGKGDEFYGYFKLGFEQGHYNTAAFQLHQATECYCSAFLLVFTDYRPKTHDIGDLCDRAIKVNEAMKEPFPRHTKEEKHMFELLRKAYVDARYNEHYTITPAELNYLSEQILLLYELIKKHCQQEIERLTAATRKTKN